MTRGDREIDGVTYAAGGLFRVITEGARLSGMKPMPHQTSAWVGWVQELHVGDVIECRGFGPGWGSDPGYGVEWTSELSRSEGVVHCDFYPSTGGMFAYRPVPGYLESVPEPEPEPAAKPDILSLIMDYESGQLDDDQTIDLFQTLIDSGMISQLQGTYQRTARSLLQQGLVTPPKE